MSRLVLLRQFSSFGLIGTAAFLVDSALLYLGLGLFGLGFYLARFLSWFGAASFTWYLNRRFTFRSAESSVLQQWLKFLAANSIGGAFNYGTYAALIATSPVVRQWPILGVAAGSVAGLVFNFFASKRYVFGT